MRLFILSVFCLIAFSCSTEIETTYSKKTITDSGYVTDIVYGETLDDWTARVVEILTEDKIDVIYYWLDSSEKQPSMCGCWSCTISGYKLKVITAADENHMGEFGFE